MSFPNQKYLDPNNNAIAEFIQRGDVQPTVLIDPDTGEAIPGSKLGGNSTSQTGLISGGDTTIDSNDALQVNITATDYIIDGQSYSLGSDSVNLSAGDSSDRYDAIVVNDTPGYEVIEGTPAANPTTPTIPPDKVLLSFVRVDAGADSSGGTGLQGVGYLYLSPNGDDSTAVAGNPMKPYGTISGAKGGYNNGQVVYVVGSNPTDTQLQRNDKTIVYYLPSTEDEIDITYLGPNFPPSSYINSGAGNTRIDFVGYGRIIQRLIKFSNWDDTSTLIIKGVVLDNVQGIDYCGEIDISNVSFVSPQHSDVLFTGAAGGGNVSIRDVDINPGTDHDQNLFDNRTDQFTGTLLLQRVQLNDTKGVAYNGIRFGDSDYNVILDNTRWRFNDANSFLIDQNSATNYTVELRGTNITNRPWRNQGSGSITFTGTGMLVNESTGEVAYGSEFHLQRNGTFSDNALLRAHNTRGVQPSGITVDDNDNVSGINNLTLNINAVAKLGSTIQLDNTAGSYINAFSMGGNNLIDFHVDLFRFPSNQILFTDNDNWGFGNNDYGGGIGVISENLVSTIPTVTPNGLLRYNQADGMVVFTQNGNKTKIGDTIEVPGTATTKLGKTIELDSGVGYAQFFTAIGSDLLEIGANEIRFGASSGRLGINNKSLSDNSSIIGAVGVIESTYSQTQSINDDSVFAFTPVRNTGMVTVKDDQGNSGVFAFNVSSQTNEAISGNVVNNMASLTGSTTGAIGTDGNITVFADGASNQIIIENRTGKDPVNASYSVIA